MPRGGAREGAGRPPRTDGRNSRLVRVALTDAEYELLIDATDPDDRRKRLMEQHFYVCTNPKCPEGHPHWAKTGKPSDKTCYACSKPLRETKSEPRD